MSRAGQLPAFDSQLVLAATSLFSKKVEREYKAELEERLAGEREAMDPYIYDLYHAVRYVEEFGGEICAVLGSLTCSLERLKVNFSFDLTSPGRTDLGVSAPMVF